MTIIEAIRKALKGKKIDEKYAERVQKAFKVEKEEDVDAAVDTFKDNLLPAITEAEATAKKSAEEAAKQKAEEDKKAAIEAYEKEHGLKDGKPIDDEKEKEKEKGKEKEKQSSLDPAIKTLIDNQNKQLTEMKDLLTKSQKKADDVERAATAKLLIKEAKLPEKWIDRIKYDSDVKLEDQIKALGEEYTEITQKTINDRVAAGEYIPGGFNVPDRSEADWLKIMDGGSTDKTAGVTPLE